MSTPKVPTPRLPLAPPEYHQTWGADLLRALDYVFTQILNPGEARATTIVLTDLQDDDVGLEVGSVYKLGNDLKIVVANIASLRGASLTSSTGTVTVDTP